MSIARMDKVTVVGLKSERSSIVETLMRLGVVDIETEAVVARPSGQTVVAHRESGWTVKTGSMSIPLEDIPQFLSRLNAAIQTAGKIKPVKKPAFTARRLVSKARFHEVTQSPAAVFDDLKAYEEASARVGEIDSQLVRLQNTADMLRPWESIEVDLGHKRTHKTRSYLGSFKSREELASLEETLAYEAPESITQVLAEDETDIHVHVITLRIRESMVLAALRRLNFSFLPVQEESATPRSLLERIELERQQLLMEREQATGRIESAADRLVDFEILHDHLQMQHDKLSLARQLESTEQTFYLTGWVPHALSEKVEQALTQEHLVAVATYAPDEGEAFPILLENRSLIRPYETVVEMYNPPQTSEIDPTAVMAPFYFLFFGMMLSDVGYGFLLTLGCALGIHFLKAKGKMKQTLTMFMQCGISAMFWGFMFGGFFGDILTVLSGGRIALKPLLFDPIQNPTTLMILSAGFGIAHLFAGMGAKAYMEFKSGNWQGAVFDIFPWYLIIAGLVLELAGIGKPFGGYAAMLGAAVILLFSNRTSKNPLARVGAGLYKLYGVTAYLGDILSYMRVLALVLATSVIAMVVNLIGFLGGPSFFGYMVFILVALLGHTINFALSLLSAYIHTLRLQFVEFFSKFFEGGGRLWKPQRLSARYVEIERESAAAH